MTLNSSSINGTVLTVNWNAVKLNLSRNRAGKRQCFVPFFKENSLCCGVVNYISDGSSFYTKRLISSRGLVSLSIWLQKANLLF